VVSPFHKVEGPFDVSSNVRRGDPYMLA